MILQELVRHYETLAGQGKVSRQGWCKAKVSYVLELDREGELIGISSLKIARQQGKKEVWVPREMEVPQMATRTVGVSANFLCDNSKYLLGVSAGGADQQSIRRFEAAKEKHLELLEGIENGSACAIRNFFLKWEPEKAREHPELMEKWEDVTAGGNLIFRGHPSINGVSVQEDMNQGVPAFLGDGPDAQRNEFDAQRDEFDAQGDGPDAQKDEFDAQKDEFDAQKKEFDAQRDEFDAQKDELYAQEEKALQEVWMHSFRNQKGEAKEEEGLCLVTGEHVEISRTHRAVKGVKGAQSSGAMLVSFNAPAFESYGKKQSYNAPVGEYAMFAYTTALNYLLGQRDSMRTFGDLTIVFWAESGEEKYQKSFLDFLEPKKENQKEIRNFFENLSAGRALDLDHMELNPEQQFCILGLSPNAARLSVRFFYKNSFGKITENIRKYYKEIEIIRPSWDDREYLGMWSVLMETVNQKAKEKVPLAHMTASLFEAVFSGRKYPESLYSNLLIRIRAEQGTVTRGRGGIVKAFLSRNRENHWLKEGLFVALNEACNDIAYILGREFAVLESIQKEANPNINATIKDRYFNSACTMPGMVFPVLMKLKENHIRKIEKRKKYFEILLTDLQGKISAEEGKSAYPKRLSLEEQGMFILGYYHQQQKYYEKKEEKRDE